MFAGCDGDKLVFYWMCFQAAVFLSISGLTSDCVLDLEATINSEWVFLHAQNIILQHFFFLSSDMELEM